MTLIDRLKAAKEGSRELDCLIWAEISNRDVHINGRNQVMATNRRPPHDACVIGTIDPGKKARNFTEGWARPPYPHYTTSVDAALTLVPKGWLVRHIFQDEDGWEVRMEKPPYDGFGLPDNFVIADVNAEGDGIPTLALALCMACLQARESEI